jgi:hypothetical protein
MQHQSYSPVSNDSSSQTNDETKEIYFATNPILDEHMFVVVYNERLSLYKDIEYGFIIHRKETNECTIVGVNELGKIIEVPENKINLISKFNLPLCTRRKKIADIHNLGTIIF